MTMQMQVQLQRTKSDEYGVNGVCSPMSVTSGGPLQRMNSMSSVRYGHYSPIAVNSPPINHMDHQYAVHTQHGPHGAAQHQQHQGGRYRHSAGPSISSMGSSVEDYTLNAVASSHDGSNASTDELQQMMVSMVKKQGHFRSPSTASSVLTIEGGGGTEMTEPNATAFNFSAVQAAKLRKKRKKKRLRDLERRLRTKDYDEKRKAMRDGLTAWDRFIDLMTPSFCSCSPAQPPTNMVARKVTAQ